MQSSFLGTLTVTYFTLSGRSVLAVSVSSTCSLLQSARADSQSEGRRDQLWAGALAPSLGHSLELLKLAVALGPQLAFEPLVFTVHLANVTLHVFREPRELLRKGLDAHE